MRSRLINCVRKNADFQVAERLAADLGMTLRVEAAPGLGHPRAVFSAPDGRETIIPLASSPGRQHKAMMRARMLRRLRGIAG